MKLIEKVLYPIIFTLVGLGIYFSKTDLLYFEGVYVREDGLIEWLTVSALILGSGICFYRANILLPFRRRIFIAALIFMGVIFLLGTIEELSWGQRFIGYETPEFFKRYNTQGEMNFHNLKWGEMRINKVFFGTFLGIILGLYFLILPLLYKKVAKIKAWVDRFAIPLPKIFHIAFFVGLFFLVQLIPSGKKGEILEFGSCWIVVLMMLEPFNREIFSRKSFER